MEGAIDIADAGGGVAVITLNRLDKHNAVDMGMQRSLDEALTASVNDGDVNCIVLTGAGEKAFSAGYDIAEMAGWTRDELLLGLLERERWIWRIAGLELPIVAAVNGHAHGWGAIAATACDMRVGGERTDFRFTSAKFGGANATWTLPHLVGHARASELLMTSRPVGAEEAERIGLLNRLVGPGESVLDAAIEMAHAVAKNPPSGIREIKRLLHAHIGRGLEDQFIAENIVMRTELRPRAAPPLPADRPVNDR